MQFQKYINCKLSHTKQTSNSTKFKKIASSSFVIPSRD